ncbi:unnamed protein product [Kuraishia capsulata CBS 1993]|uniref:R3H domain-containing protein n=1 Tax=Kuraishia capsulata CBS 1993 TaxID=1382522 RepID=W6MUP0_9ASCO|nr:uncharacterized protein KUCA_T00005430001 [Kuraishia capsulata CBS 1993]CDK29442.1 unnamed protein product [Kuraishia capsulata CBS 1993]
MSDDVEIRPDLIGPDNDSESDYATATSDSDLEDDSPELAFAERLLSEIREGTYTCLVCTGEIDGESQIWSCDACYRVYDLACIRDWAKRGSSTGADKSWRCPSCNGKHYTLPKEYRCWCGKISNPQSNVFHPHSCGQTCNKSLESCVHECSFECHPGPHMKRCTALGPSLHCNCGEKSRQVPCIVTSYDKGWQCGKVCGDLLPCGIHRCKKVCHSGACGSCPETVITKCYCGKHTREVTCSERSYKKSDIDGELWIGTFPCEDICKQTFDCGNHVCVQNCHPYTAKSHMCPLGPDAVTYCACGKKKLSDLLEHPRTSCLDPIPTCGEVCGKKLPCGHACIDFCHEGDCRSCMKTVDMKCSCEYSSFTVPCAFKVSGSTPKCTHKCQALLSCRRHRCGDVCCDFEQVALRRDRELQKGRRRVGGHSAAALEEIINNIEAKHICTKECGKLLSCGLHRCQMTCHMGPCKPCLESSSDDLVCHCGQTVVPAPVRCGTKLPVCPHQCTRPTACGHRPEYHNCHPDDQSCPKCTFLMVKKCGCDKKVELQNIMCYQENISCGRMCGKTLPCGAHKCTKLCHAEGQCLKKCPSPCGKPKDCGHICTDTCHAPYTCKAPILCNEKVTIFCKCKRISKQVLCSSPSKNTVLECDSECAKLERNRNLLQALNLKSSTVISPDSLDRLTMEKVPYSEFVLDIFRDQKKWAQGIEQVLRDLVSGNLMRETYSFKPMQRIQRQFVHEMAEAYKLDSESQDPEPKRNVFVRIKSDSHVPSMSLEEALVITEKLKERARDKLRVQPTTAESSSFYNAIAIQYVFFGMTRIAIEDAIGPTLAKYNSIKNPSVKWINDSTFVLYPDGQHQEPTAELEEGLSKLCAEMAPILQKASIAFSCALCKIDRTGTTLFDLKKPSEKTEASNDDTKIGGPPVVVPPIPADDFNWY